MKVMNSDCYLLLTISSLEIKVETFAVLQPYYTSNYGYIIIIIKSLNMQREILYGAYFREFHTVSTLRQP
jgi:hypothetical protein